MGETIPTWKPTCNSSVSVQLSNRQTSSDSGALLLREVLDHSGVIEQLEDQLVDSRDPARVKHSLACQLRTLLIQPAQGWDDLNDTEILHADPVLKLACSEQRSTTPLEQSRPSQPTLSRTINLLAEDANLPVLHESLLKLTAWRLATMHNGRPPKTLTLDVDGLPIEVFGQQTGTEWSGYLGYRHYSPLVASIAETGDMVGGLLRRGNVGNAAEADHWIPHLVRRLKNTTGSQVRVRFDAGFTGDRTLRALEEKNIEYVGRITGNSALQRLAEPYLRRPPGRPPTEPREWCHELYYKATDWKEPRKIILVVREVPGELFLRYFFLVTNLCWKSYPRARMFCGSIASVVRQRDTWAS